MSFYLTRFSESPATWAKFINNPENRRSARKQCKQVSLRKVGAYPASRRLCRTRQGPNRSRIGRRENKDRHRVRWEGPTCQPFSARTVDTHHGADLNRSSTRRQNASLDASLDRFAAGARPQHGKLQIDGCLPLQSDKHPERMATRLAAASRRERQQAQTAHQRFLPPHNAATGMREAGVKDLVAPPQLRSRKFK